jgi:hypothetical protein
MKVHRTVAARIYAKVSWGVGQMRGDATTDLWFFY